MVAKASSAGQSVPFVDTHLDESAELLKTLAHPHRLRMLQLLIRDQYTVGELAEACGLPSHMASEHLRLMQRCGLLTRRKQGRKVYYEIAQPQLAAKIVACVGAGVENHST